MHIPPIIPRGSRMRILSDGGILTKGRGMWRKSDCAAGSPAKRHGSGGLGPRCLAVLLITLATGCTGWREYLHNGCKVGPAYVPPAACVAEHWIDAADIRTEEDPAILRCWWTAFNDPTLNELVAVAYRQNLSLREAGFRILQSRAARRIVVGQIFPQRQTANGSYTHSAMAAQSGVAVDPALAQFSGKYLDTWDYGFGLELGAGLLGAVPPRDCGGRREPGCVGGRLR